MVIYHLVDTLVKHGYNAYALHQKRNFTYTWFQNETPVCYTYQIKKQRRRSGLVKHLVRFYLGVIKDKFSATSRSTSLVTVTENDILVLPATRTLFCNEILPGVPKISLSQGPYLLFQCKGLANRESSIDHPDILARIAMSRLNYDMHCLVFPEETVWDIPVFIDSGLYGYSENKKRQIAYMPRRLQKDSMALINILTLRDNLHDFSFVPIDKLSQVEVAKVLRESLIFLSFSHREGFGLPPAEAMACGCVVIGYSGNGGDEFFKEDVACKIQDGDLIAYVEAVENVIQEYITTPSSLNDQRKRASETILSEYSKEKAEGAFLRVWKEIIAKIE